MVNSHSEHSWCWNKPRATLDSLDSPRPELRGSHHLPPYSIFCAFPPHLHSNGTFSRDSQSGVPKLSWFGLSGLWAFITFRSDLQLAWGLKKTCSSPLELSNGVSYSTCTHQDQVDSRLLVVRSQTASLTPDPSFNYNLCCICQNGSYEAILDIYTSRTFQRYEENLDAKCFTPIIAFWIFGSLRRSQVPFLGVWMATSHFPQSGVVTAWNFTTLGSHLMFAFRTSHSKFTQFTFHFYRCFYKVGHAK